jgi:hypothetical protein
MMVMMVMVRMIIRHTHYFKMLNNNDATETSMLVDDSVVVCPTLELRAFTLLGST